MKKHISWHIAWASAGLITGTALSLIGVANIFADPVWLVLLVPIVLIIASRRSACTLFLALACGLIFGLYRGGSELLKLDQYSPYYGKTELMSGKVSEDASYGPRGDQRLRLSQVRVGDEQLPANIWVSTSENVEIKRGDVVTLQGKLAQGFGNIPAAVYQADIVDVARPNPGDVGRRVRDWFAHAVRLAIPEPQASLSVGYLVGQRSALPDDLNQQLQIAGLTHAVVASGYNLTILVSFARRSLAKISKYLAALSASSMVVCFVLMTGFSPSMSRAGIIALLSLAAWYYGRVIHPAVLLLFVAAVTAMIHPAYVWGDIGWYLSFAAFAGVIMFAPLVHRYFWGKTKKVNIIRQTAVDTMSAQLITLPIILLAFGKYSTYALVANILILPLVPFVMLLTFFAGVGSLLLPFGAHVFGYPATLLLQYMTSVISRVASLPNAQGEVSFGITALVASYAVLLLLAVYLWRKTDYQFNKSNPESELYSG